METDKLKTQYNNKTKVYLSQNEKLNQKPTKQLYDLIESYFYFKPSNHVKVLEFGCGGGSDLLHFAKDGYMCTGIDSSSDMCKEAKSRSNRYKILQKDFTKPLGLKKYQYHLVFSKWAMQTAPNVDKIYKNAQEMLCADGLFVFLIVHPIRQFIEKNKPNKNYFTKEIVNSNIFNNTITVHEPSHTLSEWLSSYFLSNFELITIEEDYEFPACEQINGDIYPTHMIVVCKKK